LGLKPVQLGKKIELQYIPFSELVIPWDACVESSTDPEQGSGEDTRKLGALALGTIAPESLKTLKAMKQDDLDALKTSIGQFGLLNPLEVAELPEELGFFFGKGKYVVIDGQRRYFAIRELMRLPTEQDERRRKESIRTYAGDNHIEKAETQAQEQLEKLSIRDYVLVPCLVYPYKTYLQMVRHSTEANRVNNKSLKIFLEIVENMHQQGIPDLNPDDLSNLWETRKIITEERQAIEKTLQEIRTRKKETPET
jgi:hypothetical protein